MGAGGKIRERTVLKKNRMVAYSTNPESTHLTPSVPLASQAFSPQSCSARRRERREPKGACPSLRPAMPPARVARRRPLRPTPLLTVAPPPLPALLPVFAEAAPPRDAAPALTARWLQAQPFACSHSYTVRCVSPCCLRAVPCPALHPRSVFAARSSFNGCGRARRVHAGHTLHVVASAWY